MDDVLALFLPFFLLMSRTAAFFAVLPIFSSSQAPLPVRVGLTLVLSVFFAIVLPPAMPHAAAVHWLAATVLMLQEAAIGLALGLAARFIYLAVQQGAEILAQQMGFTDSGVINPDSGEEEQPMGLLYETVFALLFLVSGSYQLLLLMIGRSYKAFPVGSTPDAAALAQGLVTAGSMMLLLGLKLAGPVLAAFLILAIVLAVLARVLPEMNVLMESYPLRVGLGLLMATAMMPLMNSFTAQLASLMSQVLAL